jgi:hypothetical protein
LWWKKVARQFGLPLKFSKKEVQSKQSLNGRKSALSVHPASGSGSVATRRSVTSASRQVDLRDAAEKKTFYGTHGDRMTSFKKSPKMSPNTFLSKLIHIFYSGIK